MARSSGCATPHSHRGCHTLTRRRTRRAAAATRRTALAGGVLTTARQPMRLAQARWPLLQLPTNPALPAVARRPPHRLLAIVQLHLVLSMPLSFYRKLTTSCMTPEPSDLSGVLRALNTVLMLSRRCLARQAPGTVTLLPPLFNLAQWKGVAQYPSAMPLRDCASRCRKPHDPRAALPWQNQHYRPPLS